MCCWTVKGGLLKEGTEWRVLQAVFLVEVKDVLGLEVKLAVRVIGVIKEGEDISLWR